MAIQISGSTVIHDSQDVQVSGVVTATSFHGDASQLTNLPAAGSSLEATASGTLSDGSTVIVNTDGTVSVVAQTGSLSPSAGTPALFDTDSVTYNSSVYDSTNQKVVIVYADSGNSNRGTAIVGTVSGTSISFGSPVIFNSSGTSQPSATFDSSNSKVVIAYKNDGNSSYGTAIVGTVSGTSISFGTPAVFNSASSYGFKVVFDSTNNKVVIAYVDNGYHYTNPNYNSGTAIVGTVSGTSISFGSSTIFNTYITSHIAITYDSTNQKVVIAYNDYSNSSRGTAVVGTVSGTSISFGSEVVFNSNGTTQNITATFDSTNDKVVIAYEDRGTSPESGTAVVGTVSGTSISFGTPVEFESDRCTYNNLTYDPTNNKVVIVYRDHGNSDYGTVIVGTVSGTSINFDAPAVFNTAYTLYMSVAFDSTNNKVVIAYRDAGNGNRGTGVVLSHNGNLSNNLTAENFIGISNGAYSDGQTATIQLIGSVDDAQSGLTPGQKYYVQGNGTLSTTAGSPSVLAGKAISSTKLAIKG